jgi:hypothetical protein
VVLMKCNSVNNHDDDHNDESVAANCNGDDDDDDDDDRIGIADEPDTRTECGS